MASTLSNILVDYLKELNLAHGYDMASLKELPLSQLTKLIEHNFASYEVEYLIKHLLITYPTYVNYLYINAIANIESVDLELSDYYGVDTIASISIKDVINIDITKYIDKSMVISYYKPKLVIELNNGSIMFRFNSLSNVITSILTEMA